MAKALAARPPDAPACAVRPARRQTAGRGRSTKAFLWLLVIIMALGYIPDRAYYFVVSRTMDLGLVLWSPVNLCPPENTAAMDCPVPVGGVLPWQPSPAQVALPAPRTGGVAAQLGTNLLYIGGSDGSASAATTFVTKVAKGNFGAWAEGPALPAARTDAALAILSGTAYLAGGLGPDGAPTDTLWSIGLDPVTSQLTTWKPVEVKPGEAVKLPAPRAGASAVAVADGIVVVGGRGTDGKPTSTVWKATLDSQGVLGQFKEQAASLPHPIADAAIALEGLFLWVYGGSDATGATGYVQRADYGPTPGPTAEPGAPPASPAPEIVIRWATLDAANLPAARTGGAGFAANGALYLRRGLGRDDEAQRALLGAAGLGRQPPGRLAARRRERPARRAGGRGADRDERDRDPARRHGRRRGVDELDQGQPRARGAVLPARHRRGHRAGPPDRWGHRRPARCPRRGRRWHGQLRHPRDHRLGVQPQAPDQRLAGAPEARQAGEGAEGGRGLSA